MKNVQHTTKHAETKHLTHESLWSERNNHMKERGASTAEHDTDHMRQRGNDRIDTDYNRKWVTEPAKGLVGFGKHKELRQ